MSNGKWDHRDWGNLVESSHTEEPVSRFALANTEDHGYVSGVRAGYEDRDRIVTHLRKAHEAGRLTGDEFHVRSEAASKAITQKELTGIVRDLPEPQRKPRKHRLSEFADSVDELHDTHDNFFHASIMLLIGLVVSASYAIPCGIIGGGETFNSGWGVFPVLTSVLGFAGLMINGLVWSEC